MADTTEKHASFDTVYNTEERAINKLFDIKNQLETLVNGDGKGSTAEAEKDQEINHPSISVLQERADKVDILSNQIIHLVETLRGGN